MQPRISIFKFVSIGEEVVVRSRRDHIRRVHCGLESADLECSCVQNDAKCTSNPQPAWMRTSQQMLMG
ncbi:hypothetical protein L2E82_16590 [Cichorium intybus]|uniref:Uncharacterized protein n=1 Tax=Cichorium intybus TaxID=13427 RepID=A0ACB9F768_CICIN|nr:hypothetical protein L2E82_16590 [Cichorium intybus]